MNRDVEKKFIRYFEYMPPIEFLRRFRDIRFSMLYVPAFRYVRVKHLLCGIFYWSFLLLPGCLVFYFIFACFPFPLVYLPAWMNTWVESIVQIGFISWSLYNIGLSFSFDTTGEWSMVMRLLSSTSIIILGCIISAISSAFPLPIPIFSVAFGLVCMVLFLPTVTHYFLVVVRGVCRIFRFMICIWEHPREALAAWGIAGIIATMAYIHSNPLLRSDIEIHLTEPYDYIILICFIMIPVAVIFFQRFLDLYWIKHQPNINSIERTALAENLERLRTRKGRRAYAKYLLEHKMRLTGAWPNGVRPNWHMGKPLKIGFLIIQSRVLDFDDVLDHDLAKLESLELKTYRYMF